MFSKARTKWSSPAASSTGGDGDEERGGGLLRGGMVNDGNEQQQEREGGKGRPPPHRHRQQRQQQQLASSAVSAVTFGSDDHFETTTTTRAKNGAEQQQPAPPAAAAAAGGGDGDGAAGDAADVTPLLPPRLVLRNLPFDQSRNIVQVRHNQGCWKMMFLVGHDWFHVLLRRPTYQSLLFLLSIWTFSILVFAGFYMAVDRQDPTVSCGLGEVGSPILWHGAFAFSLETATTVGYTLPTSSYAFFDRCPSLQVAIFFQMVYSMLFNALVIAFFYSRVAKSESRSIQVLFSGRAIVSVASGQVRFQVGKKSRN